MIHEPNLREALRLLAEPERQTALWLDGLPGGEGGFGELICQVFDDTGFSEALETGEARALLGEELSTLGAQLDEAVTALEPATSVAEFLAAEPVAKVRRLASAMVARLDRAADPLRVVSVAPAPAPTIEIDGDVPLQVRSRAPHETWYWRTGDLRASLVELGVEPRSGQLSKLTVTLLGDVDGHVAVPSDSVVGVPSFDPARWHASTTLDRARLLEVDLGSSSLAIQFAGLPHAVQVARWGRLGLLMGPSAEVVGLVVEDLSATERAGLVECRSRSSR